MDLSFDRFKKITAENSVLSEQTTSLAEDTNSPFTLIEWITNSNLDLGNPEAYIEQYGAYLRNWNTRNSTKAAANVDVVAETYKSLLKEITLKYTTEEEKRYLGNVDFNNPLDLDAVIPFYATRLKEIVIFLSKKREEAKLQKTKFGMFGTNEGIEQLVKKRILELTNTESFITEFFDTVPDLFEASKYIEVQTEELYDTKDTYFDIDPCDHDPRAISYDPKIFIDFTEAIKTNALDLGVLVQSSIDLNNATTSQAAIGVLSNSSNLDINKFPEKEFEEYIKAENKLNLNNQRALVNQLIGNNTTYLSSGLSSTNIYGNATTSYVSGSQAEASNPLFNFFNKIYPTINYSPSTTGLYTKRQLGGFFTPQHLGTSSFVSINPILKIDGSKLEENKIYEIPDPSIYGSTEYSFIDHIDNASWIKADRSNDSLVGDIIDSANLQKFYNYQSSSENNKFSKEGTARIEDNLDFWSGEERDIWANTDIFKLNYQNDLDLNSRQLTKLVNKGDIYKWQTDIFGNNFTLFKHSKPSIRASLTPYSEQASAEDTETSTACTLLDGDSFLDILTSLVPVPGLIADCSTFSPEPAITSLYIGGVFENRCSSLVDILSADVVVSLTTCDFIDGEDDLADFSATTTLSSNTIDGFSITEASYQDLDYHWNGYGFTDTTCDAAVADYLETTATVPFLSSNNLDVDVNSQTSLQSYSSPISDELSIYDQRNNSYGELWVRNINNSIISPVSSALEQIYNKYEAIHSNIKTELETKLKDFEIIYDTLILQTQNYIIFERLSYDFNNNKFKTSNLTNYITTSSTYTEKSIHHFFNEKTNKIYTGYTRNAEYNQVENINIYPEIFEFDLNNFQLKKVYPLDNVNVDEFRISDTLTTIVENPWESVTSYWESTVTRWEDSSVSSSIVTSNISYVAVDHPVLTYNELNDRYYMVTTAQLSSTGVLAQQNILAITKSEFKLFDGKFELLNSVLYWPNFGYNTEIIKNEAESIYINNGTSSTISVGPVSAFNYTLTIVPSALDSTYYNAIIYDFNDSEGQESSSRSVVEDYDLLTDSNLDDISNPLQYSKSHTYFFTGSAASTQYAYVSTIDHSFNVNVYTIEIDRQPYTLASAFGGVKLLECKSFLDDQYQEKTLISLESSNPKYVFNMALSGKMYPDRLTQY